MVPPWIAVGCRSELLAWTDLLHPDDPPQVSVVVPVCSLATPSSPANSASSSRGLPRGSVMSRLGLPVAPHGRPAGGRLHRCDHRPAAEKDLKPRPTVTCGVALAGAAVHPRRANAASQG